MLRYIRKPLITRLLQAAPLSAETYRLPTQPAQHAVFVPALGQEISHVLQYHVEETIESVIFVWKKLKSSG